MKRLARKKIVFVIVEGASDETSLGLMLSDFFDKDKVHVHIMHGDITTRRGVDAHNILAKLGKDITAYAKAGHYNARDFKQIIHIVDTDGCYIPDEKIVAEKACKEVFYQADGIHTADVSGIMLRNRQKRENLARLRSNGKIWNIPYRVYYMSCNLDHVLHNKRNGTDEEKEFDAYAFAKKYRTDINGFVKYICHSQFAVNDSFKASWDYIEKEMNSINRHSNFSICLEEEIMSRQGEEDNTELERGHNDGANVAIRS